MLHKGHKSVLLILLLLVPGSPLMLKKPFFATGSKNRVNEAPSPPLHIEAMIDLRNIVEVSERKQMVTLEATFILCWTDQRYTPNLDYTTGDYAIIGPEFLTKFWLPDILIDQVKKARTPNLMVEPNSIRLYKNSTVCFSKRMNFDVACLMDFRRFPFDSQTCNVILHSFDHTTNDYTLKWRRNSDGEVASTTNDDADQGRFMMTQYKLSLSYDDDYNMEEYEGEIKPGLILRLTFNRILTYHLTQDYIPSLLFVLVAYITLFMPPMGLVARSGVPVMVLFALFNLNNGIRANQPLVSYATLMDIWFVVCMSIVFLTIFEFCFYNAFTDPQVRRQSIANKTEVAMRFFIPAFFIVFNIVYWSYIAAQYVVNPTS